MKKIVTMLIAICMLASVTILAGGCAIFDSAGFAGRNSSTSVPKEEDVSDFVLSLYRDGATSSYWNAINYKIDYEWKNINLDIVDASLFSYAKQTKEELAADIISEQERGETIYISQYVGTNFEDYSTSNRYASLKNIDKSYNIVYNEGHTKLAKANEILVPKWMYYTLYCGTLSEIYCDKDTVERILSDGHIAQKYMFIGQNCFWDVNDKNSVYFEYYRSLPIALSYYGLLDTKASKDMTIFVKGRNMPHVGHSGLPHELSIVGYYETPMDKIFERAITEADDSALLADYLGSSPVFYFN